LSHWPRKKERPQNPSQITGWQAIAKYPGQPVTVARPSVARKSLQRCGFGLISPFARCTHRRISSVFFCLESCLRCTFSIKCDGNGQRMSEHTDDIEQANCVAWADIYLQAIKTLGRQAYMNDQKQYCQCCEDTQ
jgi:hypothetical protein